MDEHASYNCLPQEIIRAESICILLQCRCFKVSGKHFFLFGIFLRNCGRLDIYTEIKRIVLCLLACGQTVIPHLDQFWVCRCLQCVSLVHSCYTSCHSLGFMTSFSLLTRHSNSCVQTSSIASLGICEQNQIFLEFRGLVGGCLSL